MEFSRLVEHSRSIRRFDQSRKMSRRELLELVETARITPSASNRQPLKYMLVDQENEAEKVFSTLAWAAALHDWSGPAEGEHPAAYIIILHDTRIADKPWLDAGIAGVTMQYKAREMGYGACMVGAVDKKALRSLLSIPEHFSIQLVLAFGVTAEEVELEETEEQTDYYRSADGRHHVPKRRLEDIII